MGPGGTAELDNANQSYITGDFERGAQYANLHLRKIPNDGAAHYLKANCLIKLGRLDEASREYALVIKLAPDSVISTYSKTALKNIQNLPAEKRHLVPTPASNRKASPAGAARVPAGTLELIRFQAARAKEHALQSGDSASKTNGKRLIRKERRRKITSSDCRNRVEQEVIILRCRQQSWKHCAHALRQMPSI